VGQDTVRQAQVRVPYVLAPCVSYCASWMYTVRRQVFAPSACVRHVCHAMHVNKARMPSPESSAGLPS
jgi:hypothetical protein